jgi:hypothetical protein
MLQLGQMQCCVFVHHWAYFSEQKVCYYPGVISLRGTSLVSATISMMHHLGQMPQLCNFLNIPTLNFLIKAVNLLGLSLQEEHSYRNHSFYRAPFGKNSGADRLLAIIYGDERTLFYNGRNWVLAQIYITSTLQRPNVNAIWLLPE